MTGWKELVGQAGIIGNPQYTHAQYMLNEQARGMLNTLTLDAKVLRSVDLVKRLLQEVVMTERRVHRSNRDIASGMGDSTHLKRQRVGLLKALDDLIGLTGNERISQFHSDVLAVLNALETRRSVASQYIHGQTSMGWAVTAERMVDRYTNKALEFVAADFGGVPGVKPRRGILRWLTERKSKDPIDWYTNWTGYPGAIR